MALSYATIMEINSSATSGNVNAGGFNPNNANMLTNLTTDTNTGNTNSPIVSSASYNFVAGDVGHWVYIKSGTNWTPGWYKIASVASNKATLEAAIGQAIQVDATQGPPYPRYKANTVAGCATVGTPTSGTFTIDYSQGTAAILTNTDLTCTAASSTISSASGGFTPVMVGNLIHPTALTGTGAIVGWYEIVSYSSGTSVVLDRTPTNGSNNITAGTFYVGGALSLNSTLDDDCFETSVATNGLGAFRWFIKNGAYTLGESVTIAATGGTQAPVVMEGYNTLRGDSPVGANRPSIACGALIFTGGTSWDFYNLIFTGTAATVFTVGTNGKAFNVKSTNQSTTAARAAISATGGDNMFLYCEGISYRGNGINLSNVGSTAYYCWAHDSNIGINSAATTVMQNIVGCISSSNVTAAINLGAMTAAMVIQSSTLYGSENTTGIGLSIATGATDTRFFNNIVYGFATGVNHPDTQTSAYDDFNNYFNNDADVSGWTKGYHDIALNPSFTNVTQKTGTGATSTTNVLTDGSADFSSVVDGVDHVYLVSGTGTGFTAAIFGITSHTSTTLTLTSNITSSGSGSSIVYQLTMGNNFAVGTNMKATGTPSLFPGETTTSYVDIGAVQRQEPAGGGGAFAHTFVS